MKTAIQLYINVKDQCNKHEMKVLMTDVAENWLAHSSTFVKPVQQTLDESFCDICSFALAKMIVRRCI